MIDTLTDDPGQSRAHCAAWAAVAVLALLASLTRISNGFALDDVHMVAFLSFEELIRRIERIRAAFIR